MGEGPVRAVFNVCDIRIAILFVFLGFRERGEPKVRSEAKTTYWKSQIFMVLETAKKKSVNVVQG